jgi:hypothetical protein
VGKKPLSDVQDRWVDNIKMDLGEIGLVWLRIGTGGELL